MLHNSQIRVARASRFMGGTLRPCSRECSKKRHTNTPLLRLA